MYVVVWVRYCDNELHDDEDSDQVSFNVTVIISEVDSTDEDIARS